MNFSQLSGGDGSRNAEQNEKSGSAAGRRGSAVPAGIAALLVAVLLAGVPASGAAEKAATGGAAEKAKTPSPASLDRARREVRLLDDIYKTAIVLITKHYVEEKSSLAAGEAFKLLFQSMDEKGWHEVRLIDAAGEPINDDNKPSDDFEREAVKALLAGKSTFEKVETKDGAQYLRVATPIPLVMEKCTLCHADYKDKKLVGALGYRLPLAPHQ
jgi:Protein of unknown function (DUF3365)